MLLDRTSSGQRWSGLLQAVKDKDALFEKVVSSRMEVGGVNPMVCDFVTDDSVELPRLLPLVYCMNLAKKTLDSKYLKPILAFKDNGRTGASVL